MRDQDQFRGCLIGGAAGDALGYAVEFLREKQIFRRYGNRGITEYDLTNGIAEIYNSTQVICGRTAEAANTEVSVLL